MGERLLKFGTLFLCLSARAAAATLNPVILPACPTQGVYEVLEANGVNSSQTIWYVPYRIGMESGSDSISVFSWQEPTEDWLSISMNLKLLPSDSVEKCIKAAFPQYARQPIPTSRVSLQFLSSSSIYDASVDGGENLDLFDKTQWVGLNLHGPNLLRTLKQAGDTFSFRAFFRGAVIWELPYEIGGVHQLKQSLTFASTDETRLNSQVKEALHAIVP